MSSDVLVGLLLPWMLLVLERRFVRPLGLSVLCGFEPAAYAGTLVFTLALASWSFFSLAPRVSAGALAAGGTFALLVGFALFPYAVIGIAFLGLGILGFAPFWMAYVYFRRAEEAWFASARGWKAGLSAWLAFVVLLGAPLGVQVGVSRSIERALARIESADVAENERGVSTLRSLAPIRAPDELVERYLDASDPETKERLAEAWLAVTGTPIEYVFDD